MPLTKPGAKETASAASLRGRALIVATGRYRDQGLSRLPSTKVNAQGLRDVLRDPRIGNFQVTECLDLQEWRVRITDFFSSKNRDELLLLYISGLMLWNSGGVLARKSMVLDP
jgi:hypothetical protein